MRQQPLNVLEKLRTLEFRQHLLLLLLLVVTLFIFVEQHGMSFRVFPEIAPSKQCTAPDVATRLHKLRGLSSTLTSTREHSSDERKLLQQVKKRLTRVTKLKVREFAQL